MQCCGFTGTPPSPSTRFHLLTSPCFLSPHPLTPQWAHGALCLHGAVLQAQDSHLHLHPPYFTSSSSSTSSTTSPISSPSYSCVSPTWAWSRSGSGQSGEAPPLGATRDWAKPGPYDQALVHTLKRSRDRRDTTDPSSHHGADVPATGEEPQGTKGHKEDRETHEELVRVLARGLRLDIQGSSRDSLQGSSGYSSQTHTPCCSEDTLPSQVSDCDYYSVGLDPDPQPDPQQDFDRSSTIPRNSDITTSYRRMFQAKRPASTAGLPCPPPVTPGVATIRRTPSSKPNLRRPSGGGLCSGPIPIRTPMIPVKTPTVPDHPGFPGGGEATRSPLSPGAAPPSPWETSDPPAPPQPPGAAARPSERERRPLPELLEESEYGEVEDFLVAIRRGVRLKRASTNDRSAPCIY
ncbi:Metastasis suppressor protein 1 [Liparis tanakae]|uniref:Metastasis suppressor protein 1 n=1 Tax=Liparis tanakae TaxID=230148 RepID=A0A4Z2HN13_9TELE|nr:Metastasis suppressor protein 1 [Liparis tanakae]